MRRADRLFDIIQILRTVSRPITAATLAEKLEVTVRTIYRDIAALQGSRVPIEGAPGLGYVLRRGFDLPPLMFTTEEIDAIAVGVRLLRRLRDVIAPPLAPVLVAGGIVVFLTALNELTLSILLWSSGNETLGIVVFSLEQGGDNLSAAALAMLTVAATLLLMLLAGRLADRLPRGALPWQV